MSHAGKVDKLTMLAVHVAIAANPRPGRASTMVYIPRRLIDEIKAECVARGIDVPALRGAIRGVR